MAGKFEITKAGDGTFSFELRIDDKAVAKSPVFEKEDACRRGVKAVKKNSRMKVQNAIAGDEEKTNPKYLVEADGDKVEFTLSPPERGSLPQRHSGKRRRSSCSNRADRQ